MSFWKRIEKVAWRAAPTESQRLLAVTLVIGVVCALVAVAFHEAIRFAEGLFEAATHGRDGSIRTLGMLLLLPSLGGLVAGILLTKFFPQARGSGIPQVKLAYAGNPTRLRLRDAAAKFMLATLQIGSGASLGREGPTVQICAAVATSLGRFARISPKARRQLIPVGAAAGIAAAFNAPIAAVTFTVEEVVGKLDNTLLSGVIVAAALAAVIERSILGAHPVFDVARPASLEDARSLLLYALLGLTAGIASIAFTDLLLGLRKWFKSSRHIPEWGRPMVGGLGTGIIAVVVLVVAHTTGVNGGGYEALRGALSGATSVRILLALCLAKALATALSYSSGGAGGIFAPVLFIGATLGGAFGWLDVALFSHGKSATSAFALVGMGALFSGAIRAPMTSVLIIVEMTSGYELILPLMIANMSSYVVARHFRPATIYEALLDQDGTPIQERHFSDSLERTALKDLVSLEQPFVTLSRESTLDQLLGASRDASRQTTFPVLDAAMRVVGIVTADDLLLLAEDRERVEVLDAGHVMRIAVTVRATDSLRKALETMRAERLRELPVVDDDGRIAGFIDEGALVHLYLSSAPASTPTIRHR